MDNVIQDNDQLRINISQLQSQKEDNFSQLQFSKEDNVITFREKQILQSKERQHNDNSSNAPAENSQRSFNRDHQGKSNQTLPYDPKSIPNLQFRVEEYIHNTDQVVKIKLFASFTDQHKIVTFYREMMDNFQLALFYLDLIFNKKEITTYPQLHLIWMNEPILSYQQLLQKREDTLENIASPHIY